MGAGDSDFCSFTARRGEESGQSGGKIRKGAIKGGEGSTLSGFARRTVDEITLLALAQWGFAVYTKPCVRGTSENAGAQMRVFFRRPGVPVKPTWSVESAIHFRSRAAMQR